MRAVVEEHPDAAVGELVAKTVLVGVVHPLAHPDKLLMPGQGSRVSVRWWGRERGEQSRHPPLSSPLGGQAVFGVPFGVPKAAPVPLCPLPAGLPGGMQERQVRRSRTADSMMAEAVMQSSKAAEGR